MNKADVLKISGIIFIIVFLIFSFRNYYIIPFIAGKYDEISEITRKNIISDVEIYEKEKNIGILFVDILKEIDKTEDPRFIKEDVYLSNEKIIDFFEHEKVLRDLLISFIEKSENIVEESLLFKDISISQYSNFKNVSKSLYIYSDYCFLKKEFKQASRAVYANFIFSKLLLRGNNTLITVESQRLSYQCFNQYAIPSYIKLINVFKKNNKNINYVKKIFDSLWNRKSIEILALNGEKEFNIKILGTFSVEYPVRFFLYKVFEHGKLNIVKEYENIIQERNTIENTDQDLFLKNVNLRKITGNNTLFSLMVKDYNYYKEKEKFNVNYFILSDIFEGTSSIDPYSKEGFHIKVLKENTSIIYYSVGENGIDDSGKGDDISFEILK